jgi:cellulose synthase/poly-beta-1,6-N-acetylglucosamine synthase-like glycosyltransferase
MERIPQTFANHAKFDPPFHFVLFPLLFANLVWAIAGLWQAFSWSTVFALSLAVALLLMFFKIRLYSLKVQDRVIRLEERLRMKELLTPELFVRASALTVGQIVALRFASDGELPDLIEKALAGATPKELKQSIQTWRADLYRV